MCGIAGLYSQRGFIDNGTMVQMSIEMQTRGRDSCGYIAADMNGNIVVKKDILPAEEFFIKYPLKKKYKWMFVHTRAASCGKVSVENAHPFICGNIIGLQNGFCHNHKEAALDLGLPERECDSNTLFDMINLVGEPLEFTEQWSGVAVYYDKESEEINIRGSRYALPFALFDGGTAFASTKRCLANAGFRVYWDENGVEKLTLKG